ncbi:MAG TPA: hypothetical protein VFS40_04485 [Gemmatimonadales bacterium]|nr:hypothetical protein [Gemmatimonadales bacterium]
MALTVIEGYLKASLYTADLDGAHLTRLTDPALGVYGAVWSPDGTRLAFVEDYDVVILTPAGGERTVIDLPKDVTTVDWRK